MAYKSRVLERAAGGTGLNAAGASGNVLTSDGTDWVSSAPSSGSKSISIFIGGQSNSGASDTTTYYIGTGTMSTAQTTGAARYTFASSGTITACYASWSITGTATSENCSVYIRKNNTTDYTLTTTLDLSGGNGTFNATGLSISVVAGDYIQIKLVTPTWATNPTTISQSYSISYTV